MCLNFGVVLSILELFYFHFVISMSHFHFRAFVLRILDCRFNCKVLDYHLRSRASISPLYLFSISLCCFCVSLLELLWSCSELLYLHFGALCLTLELCALPGSIFKYGICNCIASKVEVDKLLIVVLAS